MTRVTQEAIIEALKLKVITRREAQELISALVRPAKELLETKEKAQGMIQSCKDAASRPQAML